MNKSIVLNQRQIHQKIERIAYQIQENTFEEATVFVGGISGNGFLLAERIVQKLIEISVNQDIRLFEITVKKDDPLDEKIKLSIDDNDLSNSTVILIDDVINSGRTMIHAVRRILENKISVLKVATLVNRTHRRYPVQADFVGMNISTTIANKIVVELGSNEAAYLE
ncbi:phosphoribosyltransferase family protein [Crocinitomix algicola]|uniref:phosphoribosyltransferase family protein n=1 Tax=Crocinitomix algicola TaxID=1740263 RepID=UPI0008378EA3|nr:phosphoribosyltransferase family protein [Crocinitomix algicola]